MKARDLSRFGKLVDQIIGLGGIEFSYIGSELSNQKELEDELWPKAITNARERAEKTLKPMGMKIDSVFAVSPINFSEIRSKFLSSGERVIVTGSNVPGPPDEPSQYRPEAVAVMSSAHVIYLISPAK